MTAGQAADRGHGKVLSDRVHSKFHGLHLVAGGNIIINTSASPDQPHTQIEAATMGYRFVPSAKPTKTLSRRPAQGKAWLPRPNQATAMSPNATFRVCRVGQPHNQHLWLPRQPRNLNPKLSPTGLQGSTRVMLDPWVSQPQPNWILGQCSDYRRNVAATSIQL